MVLYVHKRESVSPKDMDNQPNFNGPKVPNGRPQFSVNCNYITVPNQLFTFQLLVRGVCVTVAKGVQVSRFIITDGQR